MCTRVIDAEATCRHLKEMFKEHGLTPKEIQRSLNLGSIQAVYKWLSLNSATIPSLKSLVTLSGLMDCDVEDILVIRELES